MYKKMHQLLFVVMLFAASNVHAALPVIPEIPTALPDAVKQPLIVKRKPLAEKKQLLITEAESNKIKCTNIVVGSEQHNTCLALQKDFNDRVESLRTEVKQLANEINVAVNLDPMVVDARNVPSGLPKSVDNAIDTAYRDAPPGVKDRVRKGFQAVMVRDWAVAKAWFQDALNHDPNNAGLKRLVALTDTPQQPNNQQRATVAERNEPAGLGGGADMKGASAPPNKTKPTTTGDSALSEQMFEDGLQFLIMGDYEHADEMFRQADFQRNIDAGKPFSSGETTSK